MDVHPNQPAQLRRLYLAVLESEERFYELKQRLAQYRPGEPESPEAAQVRRSLNGCINEWVGFPFEGLSALQVKLLRRLLVDERIYAVLSPWAPPSSPLAPADFEQ